MVYPSPFRARRHSGPAVGLLTPPALFFGLGSSRQPQLMASEAIYELARIRRRQQPGVNHEHMARHADGGLLTPKWLRCGQIDEHHLGIPVRGGNRRRPCPTQEGRRHVDHRQYPTLHWPFRSTTRSPVPVGIALSGGTRAAGDDQTAVVHVCGISAVVRRRLPAFSFF